MGNTQRQGEVLVVFARGNDADGVDQKMFCRERIFIIPIKSEQDDPTASANPAGGCLELVTHGIDDDIKFFLVLPKALKFLGMNDVQAQGVPEFNSKCIQIGSTGMDAHAAQKYLRDQAHWA